MGSKRSRQPSTLPPPYLKRVWLDSTKVVDRQAYPFCLPIFANGFALDFEEVVTIIVGENGTGKSTILEGIAELAGFARDGGSQDHKLGSGERLEKGGDHLGKVLRGSWLPKVGVGWFFRAESFFSVARYLDRSAIEGGGPPPDFLSHSHGEGFLRFFEERCQRQGLYIFDEPESALSPLRQVEFLKLLRAMEDSGRCQVVIATHSPILMALPRAKLLRLSKYGLAPIRLEDTDHFRMLREFCLDPHSFIDAMMAE